MRARFLNIFAPLLGLCLGLGLGLLLTKLAGESPGHVLAVLVKSAFGTRYDFGLTLFYTTPLIFCGLSVAIAFHAGLFNIGAEGQLSLGAFAAAVVGYLLPHIPGILAPIVAMLAAMLTAGFWGWIAGWLRTRRGSHEVINTIMLNFVAAGIISWLLTAFFQNKNSQNPETPDIGPAYFIRPHDPIAQYFGEAPASCAIIVALLAAIALWFFLYRTVWGFEIRATGQNEEAAKIAGIDVAKMRQLAMFLAGAFAGCVALGEIMGGAGRFRLGFSADYGFIGIAVALLARNEPLLIIPAGLLFGALHKGAADLDIETEHVTRDLAVIIQALVILLVAVFAYLPKWFVWKKKSKKESA